MTALDSQLIEQVGGILSLMKFFALRGFAHGLSREFVGSQIEGQGVLVGDPRENNAHHVRYRESHLIEHRRSPLFHFGVNARADDSVGGHLGIVAQLGYNLRPFTPKSTES